MHTYFQKFQKRIFCWSELISSRYYCIVIEKTLYKTKRIQRAWNVCLAQEMVAVADIPWFSTWWLFPDRDINSPLLKRSMHISVFLKKSLTILKQYFGLASILNRRGSKCCWFKEKGTFVQGALKWEIIFKRKYLPANSYETRYLYL